MLASTVSPFDDSLEKSLAELEGKPSKLALKRGLQNILSLLSSDAVSTVFESISTNGIDKLLDILIYNCSFPADIVRETVALVMERLLQAINFSPEQLKLADKALIERLKCEEVEEIATAWIKSFHVRLSKYEIEEMDDIVTTLKFLLRNKSSEVLKLACQLVLPLSRKPVKLEPYVVDVSPSIIKLFKHKHASIRQEALKSFESLVLIKSTPLENEEFPDVFITMCGDSSTAVRSTLYTICGNLALNLRDNYTHMPKLIPIILVALHDPISDVALMSGDFLSKVGLLYEEDHCDQVKDELDLFTGSQNEVAVVRPGVSHIVNDNLLKLVNKSSDLTKSWNSSNQIVGLKLLSSILKFTNVSIVGYSKQIFESVLHVMGTLDELKNSNLIPAIARKFAVIIGVGDFIEAASQFMDETFSNTTHANVIAFINHAVTQNTCVVGEIISFLQIPVLLYNSGTEISREIVGLISHLSALCGDNDFSTQELADITLMMLFYSDHVADATALYQRFIKNLLEESLESLILESLFIQNLKTAEDANKKIAVQFLRLTDFTLFSESSMVHIIEKLLVPFSLAILDDGEKIDIFLRNVVFDTLLRICNQAGSFKSLKALRLLFEETILKNIAWHRQRESHICREKSLKLLINFLDFPAEHSQIILARFEDVSCLKLVTNCLHGEYQNVRKEAALVLERLCLSDNIHSAPFKTHMVDSLSDNLDDEEQHVRLMIIRSMTALLGSETDRSSKITDFLSRAIVYMDDEDDDIRQCTRNLFVKALKRKLVSPGLVQMHQSNFKHTLDFSQLNLE